MRLRPNCHSSRQLRDRNMSSPDRRLLPATAKITMQRPRFSASGEGCMRSKACGSALGLGALLATAAIAPATGQEGVNLYVPNFAGNNMSVIDTGLNASAGPNIAAGLFPEMVAVSGDQTFLYVTNAGSDTVSVIDTSTNTV